MGERKPKFTPGPWGQDYLVMEAGKPVAVTISAFHDEGQTEICTTSAANARLIAAAPTMYSEIADLSRALRLRGFTITADAIDRMLNEIDGDTDG